MSKKRERVTRYKPIEGADGRYYFRYGIMTEYELKRRTYGGGHGEPIQRIRIENCRLSKDETELYEVLFESTGKTKEYSLEELETMLTAGNAEELEAGIAKELPLIQAEVTWYYSVRKKVKKQELETAVRILYGEPDTDSKTKKQNRDKNGKLKWNGGSEAYRNIIERVNKLVAMIAEDLARNGMVTEELRTCYASLCAERKAFIEKQGIDPNLFRKEEVCRACNDTGIKPNGEICECAYAQEEQIKQFVAREKLKKRLEEEWLTPLTISPQVRYERTETEALEEMPQKLTAGTKEGSDIIKKIIGD